LSCSYFYGTSLGCYGDVEAGPAHVVLGLREHGNDLVNRDFFMGTSG